MQLSKVLQERAETIVSELQQPFGRNTGNKTISIQGEVGIGKTSLLHHLTTRLADDGLKPVFVSPPFRAVDTAPAVIMQIADSFRNYGLMKGDGDSLASPNVHLDAKLDLLGKVAATNRKDIVLLCDEPREWLKAEAEDSEDHYVQDRKEKVVDELSRWGCRCVFAGRSARVHPSLCGYTTQAAVRLRARSRAARRRLAGCRRRTHRPPRSWTLAVVTALARRLLMASAKATSVDAAVELYLLPGPVPGLWLKNWPK